MTGLIQEGDGRIVEGNEAPEPSFERVSETIRGTVHWDGLAQEVGSGLRIDQELRSFTTSWLEATLAKNPTTRAFRAGWEGAEVACIIRPFGISTGIVIHMVVYADLIKLV